MTQILRYKKNFCLIDHCIKPYCCEKKQINCWHQFYFLKKEIWLQNTNDLWETYALEQKFLDSRHQIFPYKTYEMIKIIFFAVALAASIHYAQGKIFIKSDFYENRYKKRSIDCIRTKFFIKFLIINLFVFFVMTIFDYWILNSQLFQWRHTSRDVLTNR